MRLTQLLERLGLVVAVPAPPAEPAAPVRFETRVVTLAELRKAAGLRAEAFDCPASGIGLEVSCEQVLQRAALPAAAHGWTADTVMEQLARPEFRNLEPHELRCKMAQLLNQNNVRPEDILADAQRRDETLDRYEAQLKEKVDAWQAEAHRRAQDLRAQAQQLIERADAEAKEIERIRTSFAQWQSRKREKEAELERIALAVAEKPSAPRA